MGIMELQIAAVYALKGIPIPFNSPPSFSISCSAVLHSAPYARLSVVSVVGMHTSMFLADSVYHYTMYWEHRFNHMVKRYNDIYRV